MDLSDLAERVLFGESLQVKLGPPTPGAAALVDLRKATAGVPDWPSRPPGLSLARRPVRQRFPGADALRDPAHARRALHAFANHELLAAELMALALLRWPDAEAEFRQDLGRSLRDELRHLRLYLERLNAQGGELGEEPLSAFFWTALKGCASPREFTAGLSLTLEQANLDFARYYGEAFAAAGDAATAKVLRRVHADEVVHVARGIRWLDAWKEPGQSRWLAWAGALRSPLTPRRARGPVLDREGRRKAGLDEAWIERLAGFGASRGRPPVHRWYGGCEEVFAGGADARLRADLQSLPALLASTDDVVWMDRPPGPQWRSDLLAAGLPVPRFEAGEPPLGVALEPWAWTPQRSDDPHAVERPRLASKAWAAERLAQLLPRLRELAPPGALLPDRDLPSVVRDGVELEQALGRLTGRPLVLKAPHASSGREQRRLLGPPTEGDRAWASRRLAVGPLRVEPWLSRVVDLGFLARAGRGVGVHRFLADRRGAFAGVLLGSPTADLPASVGRFLTADGGDPAWLGRAADALLEELFEPALGAFGVDAFVYRDETGLRLHPFVELNPRFTVGHAARRLRERVAPGVSGVWALLTLKRLGDPRAWLATARRDLPERRDGRGRWLQGILPTNDPGHAQAALGVLAVGERALLQTVLEPVAPGLVAAWRGDLALPGATSGLA